MARRSSEPPIEASDPRIKTIILSRRRPGEGVVQLKNGQIRRLSHDEAMRAHHALIEKNEQARLAALGGS